MTSSAEGNAVEARKIFDALKACGISKAEISLRLDVSTYIIERVGIKSKTLREQIFSNIVTRLRIWYASGGDEFRTIFQYHAKARGIPARWYE